MFSTDGTLISANTWHSSSVVSKQKGQKRWFPASKKRSLRPFLRETPIQKRKSAVSYKEKSHDQTYWSGKNPLNQVGGLWGSVQQRTAHVLSPPPPTHTHTLFLLLLFLLFKSKFLVRPMPVCPQGCDGLSTPFFLRLRDTFCTQKCSESRQNVHYWPYERNRPNGNSLLLCP